MGALGGGDARWRARFQTLLLDAATRDREAGWQQARELGHVAVPLLREMLAAERADVERRVTVLIALATAGGIADDERFLATIDQSGSLEERVVGCMLLAMGPTRSRPVPNFWTRVLPRQRVSPPPPVLAVAACLAAARFPGAAAAAPAFPEPDIGLQAAMAAAGIALPERVTAAAWNLREAPRHAELLWRGALLGRLRDPQARADEAPWPDRAGRLLGTGETAGPAGALAALLLGRARACRLDVRPPSATVVLLGADPEGAAAVREWLPAVPLPLDEDRPRLAVEYVFSRDVAAVVADQVRWAKEAEIRAHVAVALAFRLCGQASPTPIETAVPGVPEWFFVRWASGAPVTAEADCKDPLLARAQAMAAAGRLPRDVARTVLEEFLWRSGSHPGLGLWREEQRFVRDLLLTGSHPGMKYPGPATVDQRYLPKGVGRTDAFLEIAVQAWDWLKRPVPPVPPGCRLR